MKALFVVPAILLLSGGASHADITRNTPGANCVATSGTLVSTSDGQAANTSTSSASAVCPIDRDLAPTSSTKVAATVWVLDQNSSADVCCVLHAQNPSGARDSSPASGSVCSTGASSTYQAIALPQLSVTTGSYSHYDITCTVPGTSSSGAQSMILTYRSVEE